MEGFLYFDQLHIKIVPRKNLFKSTMVHNVINRGDIFAFNTVEGTFTVVKGPEYLEAKKVEVDIYVPVLS